VLTKVAHSAPSRRTVSGTGVLPVDRCRAMVRPVPSFAGPEVYAVVGSGT
jgi:hypothetical protein